MRASKFHNHCIPPEWKAQREEEEEESRAKREREAEERKCRDKREKIEDRDRRTIQLRFNYLNPLGPQFILFYFLSFLSFSKSSFTLLSPFQLPQSPGTSIHSLSLSFVSLFL